MANPEFSVRHVTTRSKLPATLIQGRAYFIDDEGSIVVNHGSGGITYGKAKQTDTNASAIGTLSQLKTPTKSNLVSAVNEAYDYSSNRTYAAMGAECYGHSLNDYYNPRYFAPGTESLTYIERLLAGITSGKFEDVRLGDAFYVDLDMSGMFIRYNSENYDEDRGIEHVVLKVAAINPHWYRPIYNNLSNGRLTRPHVVLMQAPNNIGKNGMNPYRECISIYGATGPGNGRYLDLLTNGYLGWTLRNELQTLILPQIRAIFGATRIKAMPDYFSNAVTDGVVTGIEDITIPYGEPGGSFLEVANLEQLTGVPYGNGNPRSCWGQFPLFRHCKDFWPQITITRDVGEGGTFVGIEAMRAVLLEKNYTNRFFGMVHVPWYFIVGQA